MVVVNLMQHCDRERFEPVVLCLGELGPLAERISSLDIEVSTLHRRFDYKGSAIVPLVGRLHELRPDVLHTHNPGPHLSGSIAGWLTKVPALVHTKHGRNCLEPTYSSTASRLASRLSSIIVAVSDDAANVARSIERVPDAKLEVLRNGVDLDRYPFRGPRAQGGEIRAIHVARLNWIKDQPTLLRAARLVADVDARFRLDIVGDGPERPTLEQLIRELGLENVVVLHGFRDDVSGELAKADFFVLSSISEGISLTLLEAMAVGLPVVATDVGGNREVVVPGVTGLLAPAKSPRDLALAILDVIRCRKRSTEMAYAARRRVEQHFNLRTVVRQYESIYQNLLGRNCARQF